MTHLFLRKANDDLISHCRCVVDHALIMGPNQLECPWCGCGWLFICGNCRKAFTFAEAFETNEPWEMTASRALRAMYQREPGADQIEGWINAMKVLLKGIQPGVRYVYFDGWMILTHATSVRIEGWHSEHDLDFVPHVAALHDPDVDAKILSSQDYWLSTAIEQ